MECAALLVVSALPLEVSKAGHGNVSNANKEWGSDQIASRCCSLALYYVSDFVFFFALQK